ncbi:MAG: phosphatase PAP2 family protein [Eubacteriales bacterium]
MHKWRLASITFSLLFFLLLGIFLKSHGVWTIDATISSSIYQIRTPILTLIMKASTYAASWQSIVFFCLFMWAIPYSRKTFALPVSLFCIASSVLNEVLKAIFQISRPLEATWLMPVTGYSFPSGHSMTGFMFFSIMILVVRKYLIKSRPLANIATGLLVLLIILIGFSRIYLGVHFPSDIIGGFLVGFALALFFEPAADSLARKNIGYKRKTHA